MRIDSLKNNNWNINLLLLPSRPIPMNFWKDLKGYYPSPVLSNERYQKKLKKNKLNIVKWMLVEKKSENFWLMIHTKKLLRILKVSTVLQFFHYLKFLALLKTEKTSDLHHTLRKFSKKSSKRILKFFLYACFSNFSPTIYL